MLQYLYMAPDTYELFCELRLRAACHPPPIESNSQNICILKTVFKFIKKLFLEKSYGHLFKAIFNAVIIFVAK